METDFKTNNHYSSKGMYFITFSLVLRKEASGRLWISNLRQVKVYESSLITIVR